MGGPTDSSERRIRVSPDRCVGFESAREVLRSAIGDHPSLDAPVLIGVGGRVGSGKTTLAHRLGGQVLSTDDYLPDYETIPDIERDEPDHADLETLSANLRHLIAGKPTRVPTWSFEHHRRIGEREFLPAPLLVVEGIHALHPRVRELAHVLVLVEASREVRWSRWTQIEEDGQRGWGVEHARWHFENVAEPVFDRFEGEYRLVADLIVRNDA